MSVGINCSPTIQFGTRSWYRHVCAVGGVFNILTMLAANLVGFVIGTDGIAYMIGQLTDSWKGMWVQRRGLTVSGLISPNPTLVQAFASYSSRVFACSSVYK